MLNVKRICIHCVAFDKKPLKFASNEKAKTKKKYFIALEIVEK